MKFKILLIFLVLAAALVLFGCGEEEVQQNPELAVQQLFEATVELDIERARSYISSNYQAQYDREFAEVADIFEEGGDEAEFLRTIYDAFFDSVDLQTVGHYVDGDSATVDIAVSIPDMDEFGDAFMGAMFELMFSEDVDVEAMTEEEVMLLMSDMIKDVIKDVSKVERSGVVQLVMEEGQWKVDSDFLADIFDEMDF